MPLRVVVIILGAALARFVVHRLVDRYVRKANERHENRFSLLGPVGGVLANATGYGNERHEKRVATAATIVKSTVSVIIIGTALLMILDLFGIPLGPLLASAGVAGLAIGFGAQSLVKDTLSGLFMIVEDQYGVGDVIDTGTVVGTVEEVTLRITRLRDGDGVVWYIRNGEILRLGNRSQGWSVAVVDVQLAYTDDIVRVTGIMTAAVEDLAEHEELVGRAHGDAARHRHRGHDPGPGHPARHRPGSGQRARRRPARDPQPAQGGLRRQRRPHAGALHRPGRLTHTGPVLGARSGSVRVQPACGSSKELTIEWAARTR